MAAQHSAHRAGSPADFLKPQPNRRLAFTPSLHRLAASKGFRFACGSFAPAGSRPITLSENEKLSLIGPEERRVGYCRIGLDALIRREILLYEQNGISLILPHESCSYVLITPGCPGNRFFTCEIASGTIHSSRQFRAQKRRGAIPKPPQPIHPGVLLSTVCVDVQAMNPQEKVSVRSR